MENNKRPFSEIFIYWVGLINIVYVFAAAFIYPSVSPWFLLNTIYFYLPTGIIGLLLWRKIMKRNYISLLIQLVVLSIVAALSLILTLIIVTYGTISADTLRYIIQGNRLDMLTIFFSLIGISPGWLIDSAYFLSLLTNNEWILENYPVLWGPVLLLLTSFYLITLLLHLNHCKEIVF